MYYFSTIIVTNIQNFFGVRHVYKNLHFSIHNFKAKELV